MTDLLITRGIPGSGKTTWALRWLAEDPAGRVRVNRDDLRQALYGCGYPLHPDKDVAYKREVAVSAAQQEAVRALLREGRDVVVDDTHIRARYVRQWEEVAADEGADFRVEDCFTDTPLDVCIQRDAARDRVVGEAAIRDMHSRLRSALKAERKAAATERPAVRTYTGSPGQHPAWIFDIDGTLAHTNGRSPYDYTCVGTDTVDERVRNLAHNLVDFADIIVVSGRDAVCRADTAAWLYKHLGWNPPLFMRAEGDRRDDATIKAEIFWEHIAPNWDVLGVFDDRNRVVRMWRAMGLLCCQVAPGAF